MIASAPATYPNTTHSNAIFSQIWKEEEEEALGNGDAGKKTLETDWRSDLIVEESLSLSLYRSRSPDTKSGYRSGKERKVNGRFVYRRVEIGES